MSLCWARLTGEVFRESCLNRKPGDAEGGSKFGTRLEKCIGWWVEMAETPKRCEDLLSGKSREPFMRNRHGQLAVFLKERKRKTVREITELTDQYICAHSQ